MNHQQEQWEREREIGWTKKKRKSDRSDRSRRRKGLEIFFLFPFLLFLVLLLFSLWLLLYLPLILQHNPGKSRHWDGECWWMMMLMMMMMTLAEAAMILIPHFLDLRLSEWHRKHSLSNSSTRNGFESWFNGRIKTTHYCSRLSWCANILKEFFIESLTILSVCLSTEQI